MTADVMSHEGLASALVSVVHGKFPGVCLCPGLLSWPADLDLQKALLWSHLHFLASFLICFSYTWLQSQGRRTLLVSFRKCHLWMFFWPLSPSSLYVPFSISERNFWRETVRMYLTSVAFASFSAQALVISFSCKLKICHQILHLKNFHYSHLARILVCLALEMQ